MGIKHWCFLAAAIFVIAAYADQAAGTDFHGTSAGFTVTIPNDWVQIPDNVVQQDAALFAARNNSNPAHWLSAYQQKSDDWFRYPYLIIGTMSYPGNAQPSEDQIAQQIKNLMGVDLYQQIKEHNSALVSKVILGASIESAQWDGARHAVDSVSHASVATWGLVKGYSATCFGKKGMVQVACCDTDDQFDARLPIFRKVGDSLRFDPGFAYDPSLAPAPQGQAGPRTPEQMEAFGQSTVEIFLVVAGFGAWLGWKRATGQLGQRPSTASQPPSLPGPPPLP
jgi:hypothetical protein